MEALSYCQLMERCLAAEARVVELEKYKAAFTAWQDKTEWVQKDSRFDILLPWGKHRADVLKEYIELLERKP